ncbi:PqqD family protein [Microbispora sp. SCL1-1]|uniref:PqqD family protein n=1 Tax=Microbispora TaxID=2005 RepID=UPI00115902BD|nr:MULTISPECIES: PqqD family protein [unclassified Microbispora]NJP27407.1 PqqD family protein [Microbispora sp. CL1-1]TQS11195.1 PqqD family protein [Microbispora sp. SCL1-1]
MTSRVVLRELGVRPDRGEWIVGRVSTGDFVALPEVGMRVLRLLGDGLPVEDIQTRLRQETGAKLDIDSFVRHLADAGLVAAIDGRPVPAPDPPRPTFPWLRPGSVRWTLNPVLHICVVALIAVGVVLLIRQPALLPNWRAILWSPSGAAVLFTRIAVGWLMLFVHEMAHLVTARAAGVPGRVAFGTRLQFLAVQTDVSGIWLAPRRVRLTVYLSGIAVDIALCAACVILSVLTGPHPAYSIALLTGMSMLATQACVFMRTDLYFVLQDLTGCRNMYGDVVTYVRYGLARLMGRRRPGPIVHVSRRERRWLAVYGVVLVGGTIACLAVFATITLPVTVALVVGAVRTLISPGGPSGTVDAVVVLTLLATTQFLWLRAWWRRHGRRLRRRGAAVVSA